MKQTYFLKNPAIQQNAIKYIEQLPTDPDRYLMVTIQEPTRSLEQSAKLHAIFGELANKATYNGEKLTLEQWKVLLVSAHTIATKEAVKMVIGIEGEVINLRESTAKMSVKRMTSLIEYVTAWAAMNDIALSQ